MIVNIDNQHIYIGWIRKKRYHWYAFVILLFLYLFPGKEHLVFVWSHNSDNGERLLGVYLKQQSNVSIVVIFSVLKGKWNICDI